MAHEEWDLGTEAGRAAARAAGYPVPDDHAPDIQRLADLIDGPGGPSEKEWQWRVRNFAESRGWRCYHTWLSVRSDIGFPDLVLVRGAVIFAELKTERGKVTAAQQEWLDALRAAGQEAFVWRPRDWPLIQERLA